MRERSSFDHEVAREILRLSVITERWFIFSAPCT